MKNTTFGFFCSFLTIFIVASGCDNGDGNGNSNNNQGFLSLARMSIEDANNLLIAENPETLKEKA